MKSTHPAFTLIEMVVVIALAAFAAATIIPRLLHHTPTAEVPTVLAELNELMFFARQEAISTQSVRRLAFKQNAREVDTVTVQEEIDNPERPGKKIWQQVPSDVVKTGYTFHPSIKLKSFFHKGNKQNDFEEQKGEGYCYIMPDGLVDAVRVQLARKDSSGQAEYLIVFISEPFVGSFTKQEGR